MRVIGMKKYRPHFLIVAAASLWGLISVFVKNLTAIGFSAMEIVAVRAAFAFLLLGFFGMFRRRGELRLDIRHFPYFVGTGIFSIVFFNWCYFTAINELSVSLAVILLYTAPAFVALLSVLFLKEPFSRRKGWGVAGTMVGCLLLSGVMDDRLSGSSLFGFAVGLGSGLGYALYTIFGKFCIRHYSSFATTLYTFLAASLFLVPYTRLWEKLPLLADGKALLFSLGLAFVPTVLAYLLYTEGLRGVDGSVAAVLATVEPVVAFLIGMTLYGERFAPVQWIGGIVVLLSVLLVQKEEKGNIGQAG